MNDTCDPAREVLVVLDPDFGDRLRDIWRGQPFWIAGSPANDPAVRALLNAVPASNPNSTTFTYVRTRSAEENLLSELYSIDLHFGPYSTETPYTVLRVIGAQLTKPIREALTEYGFSAFRETAEGFLATRSKEASAIKR